MKKTFLNTENAAAGKTLSRAEMKKINGGIDGCNEARCFHCGCIDDENNFYRGACGPAYCYMTYGGEPWCIRVC
jgi:hypothetical protein